MTPGNPPFEIVIDDDLVLKRLRLESSETIFEAVNQNRPHLRTWLPFVDQTWKVSDTELFIKSVIYNQCPKKDLVYEIWSREEFAGLIALKELDHWNRKTELGYWIIKKFEGHGLVIRSCRKLIDLSFNEMKINRIQIKAGVGNTRSCLVPERLGFKLEGIERQGEKLSERFTDLATYSLLKNEWG